MVLIKGRVCYSFKTGVGFSKENVKCEFCFLLDVQENIDEEEVEKLILDYIMVKYKVAGENVHISDIIHEQCNCYMLKWQPEGIYND